MVSLVISTPWILAKNSITIMFSLMCPSLYHDWQKRKIKNPDANLENFAVVISDKLFDLPPELSKSSKPPGRDKAVSAAVSKRVLTHQSVSNASVCVKCGKSVHVLSDCEAFKAMKVDERFEFAKNNAICFRCLDPVPHKWNRCSQRKFCGIEGCSKHHHPLLHLTAPRSSINSSAPAFTPRAQIHSSHLGVKAPVMFKVVPIRPTAAIWTHTYAFLDDGSSIEMIEREVYEYLNLKGEPESLVLHWTKGVSRTEQSIRTTLGVSAVNKVKRFTLKDIYTVNGLELPSQTVNVSTLQKSFAHLKDLPLIELNNAKPKILLGLDQASRGRQWTMNQELLRHP
ncbi:uncharacterized protein LOC129906408 [Episyrphus balteatus]|uniref:uncharacterized protein LOC129906408 n=1 Tax=Episyrphus balteatus TaxID=286459 RepID=UPI0024860C15|nr:uncharacterized protein LOC129906408 [Episyrphus balteatus]